MNRALFCNLSLLLCVTLAPSVSAVTIAYLRFEESSAVVGEPITEAKNESEFDGLDGSPNNNPAYSDDVPFPVIKQGIDGPAAFNEFSLLSKESQEYIGIPDNEIFNSENFTIEFFAKVVKEPTAFMQMVQKGTGTPSYLIQFHYSNNTDNYGKVASRYVRSDGAVTSRGNFPQYRIFVDTLSGNGDYTTYGSSPRTEGDGFNDDPTNIWHHIAYVYTGATNQLALFFDGIPQTAGAVVGGAFEYPAGNIKIGIANNSGPAEVLIDEFRYSDVALIPDEFLREGQPEEVPEVKSTITIFGIVAFIFASLTRRKRR